MPHLGFVVHRVPASEAERWGAGDGGNQHRLADRADSALQDRTNGYHQVSGQRARCEEPQRQRETSESPVRPVPEECKRNPRDR